MMLVRVMSTWFKGQLITRKRQVWLWQCRLGHSSFSYLQHVLPNLFFGCSAFDFKCDTCILAKSHCVPYLLSCNKSIISFGLIHSDVWGAISNLYF